MTETVLETKNISKEESLPQKILFVCTGNTCRSPMAEAVGKYLQEKELAQWPDTLKDLFPKKWEFYSAGLSVFPNDPIAENACCALMEEGIPATKDNDYPHHIAKQLTEEMLAFVDKVYCMTNSHLMALITTYPKYVKKFFLMPKPINDPYGMDLETYKSTLHSIMDAIRTILGDNV